MDDVNVNPIIPMKIEYKRSYEAKEMSLSKPIHPILCFSYCSISFAFFSLLRPSSLPFPSSSFILLFCPPCSYLVVTNPLLSFPDPRLSGKKRRSKEEGASTKDLREWEENVEAMRRFTKSLYAERGTAHWTESVEFDLHERRMWDECVPPREFGPVPTFNLQADGAYQQAWRSMTVCKDDERITEIPAVCKKLDGDAKKCGATPQTIGRCRWRESKCRAFSLFPHWGKIEFTDCKAGSVGETVCGEVMYQWCRRVYPGTQALATAKGPLKLDD